MKHTVLLLAAPLLFACSSTGKPPKQMSPEKTERMIEKSNRRADAAIERANRMEEKMQKKIEKQMSSF